jgi:hypothetical protein
MPSASVEGNLDLRNALGGRRNAYEIEVTEDLVVPSELTLSSEDLDLNGSLTVSSSRECLRLLGRDGRVTADKLGHDTTKGLDTEGERSNIEQKNVSDAYRGRGVTSSKRMSPMLPDRTAP